MLKSNFEKLKKDESVYYIYRLDFSICGINDTPKYLVVVSDNWKYPKEEENNEVQVDIVGISNWFKKIEKGNISPWICACLSRKYIIKEYVKLMLKTDPIQLRSDINMEAYTVKGLLENENCPKEELFRLITHTIFSRQIVENHKIINFNEPAKYYNLLFDNMSVSEFNKIYSPVLKEFKDLTQGVWVRHLKSKVQ